MANAKVVELNGTNATHEELSNALVSRGLNLRASCGPNGCTIRDADDNVVAKGLKRRHVSVVLHALAQMLDAGAVSVGNAPAKPKRTARKKAATKKSPAKADAPAKAKPKAEELVAAFAAFINAQDV